MTLEALNYITALPEIFLLSMTCLVLLVDVFLRDAQRNVSYVLAQLSLLGTFLLLLQGMTDAPVYAYNNMFIQDGMADLLKLCVVVIVAVVFVYSRDYLRDRGLFKGEFYLLALFATLGMMLMISSASLLMLYLGLELLSLCLYAMVALHRDNGNAAEAAMKYFVLGAIASGMLLYGMSILYGLSGSLLITDVASAVTRAGEIDIGVVFALVFVLVALMFKLGAVPFHMWVPDVYQGSPTAVTVFLGTAPKLAAFAIIIRLLVEGLGGLHTDWQQMLVIIAVLSMAIGNVVAIAQANIKRMLAYSTISHVGFIILGILVGTAEGYSAALFYTIAYAMMSLGGFGIVMLLARAGFEADQLDDFKGLNQRSPWFAFMMLILMFSMAGVPPTLGFWAKLAVLKAIIHIDMVWLAGVAVFFSIIGLFYYLRIIKLMYFDDKEDTSVLQCSTDMQFVLSGNALMILGLGFYPAGLMALCISVFV